MLAMKCISARWDTSDRDDVVFLIKELKLKEEAGVEITRVDPGSPAEKAGLKNGDVVLEYQGNRVEGAEQFVRFVRETPVGRQVKLKVVRNGSNQAVTATIGSRPGIPFPVRQRVEEELARVREQLRELPEIRVMDVPRAVMGWRSGRLRRGGSQCLAQALDLQFGQRSHHRVGPGFDRGRGLHRLRGLLAKD